MQAVILAAGRGARMGSLTDGAPKALLEVRGKTLIEYKLEALPEEVDEVLIIVGYMGSAIQNFLGGFYGDKRLLYVEQEEPHGTAGALWSAKEDLHDSFLVMNGDDVYVKEDIERAARAKDWAVVGIKDAPIKSAARIVADKHGKVTNIIETEGRREGNAYINTGLYKLDMRVFETPMVPKSPGSKEYGLPQTLIKADVPLWLISGTFWLSLSTPEDLEAAEKALS